MFTFLISIQVLIAAGLIGLILVQHGKGADMGAAFGSGASGTVFGSQGSGSFLTRATTVLAVLFFLNSLFLATPLVKSRGQAPTSVTENIKPVEAPAPAQDADKAGKGLDLPDLPAGKNDLPE